MSHTTIPIAASLALFALVAACDDSPPEGEPTTSVNATSTVATSTGSSMGGNGAGGGAPDCYENPTTHEEIINACTDAEKIDKDPVLPLRNPDGSLPPIP